MEASHTIQNIQKIFTKYIAIINQLGKLYSNRNNIEINKQMMLYNQDYLADLHCKIFQSSVDNIDKIFNFSHKYYNKFTNIILDDALTQEHNQNSDTKAQQRRLNNTKSTQKDKRFKTDAWDKKWFFQFVKQYYLNFYEMTQEYITLLDLEEEDKVYCQFIMDQILNAISPSNVFFLNPEALQEAANTQFKSIINGMDNFLADLNKSHSMFQISTNDCNSFTIGNNIAKSNGKIIYQNEIMQLICYKPNTNTYSVPIFLVPSWINKYYILDLSESNSLIAFLQKNNFQVFTISWQNPVCNNFNFGFEDYIDKGINTALAQIKLLGYDKINCAGYCLGGTLLACAAAISYSKALNTNAINTLSFLTTLLDFRNPGALSVFINHKLINLIESIFEKRGYLDGIYLANCFNLLRSNDLIWSFVVNNYLLGKNPNPYDILYWNSDHTNIPLKAHLYYLRKMYLENSLILPNKLNILNTPIDLSKITCDSFFLATKDDHIAPWTSALSSANLLTNSHKNFCLSGAGHIAGVINPPETNKYEYLFTQNNDSLNSLYALSNKIQKINNISELYRALSICHNNDFHYSQGSWWGLWKNWLQGNSDAMRQSIDYQNLAYIEYAPGSYSKNNKDRYDASI